MTITSTTSTSDGVTATFSVPFPFFSRAHVEVLVDGAAYGGTVTWISDSAISLSPVPASGVKVTRRRVTPDTPARSTFTNSNIVATGLNANQTQDLYLAQEKASELARSLRVVMGEDGPVVAGAADRAGMIQEYGAGGVSRTDRSFMDIVNTIAAMFGIDRLLSSLDPVANTLAYFTSSSTMALTSLVSQARSFLADPSAPFVNFLQSGVGAALQTLHARLLKGDVIATDFAGVVADAAFNGTIWIGTDNLAGLQAVADHAFATKRNLYIPAGNYLLSNSLVTPGTVDGISVDDRDKCFRIYGAGAGEPFVVSVVSGTTLCANGDFPVMRDNLGTDPSSNGTLEIDHLRFDGASTTPVVLLQSFYGISQYHHCVIYQRGTGDGLKVTYGGGFKVYESWALNSDLFTAPLGAARTGIGFNYEPTYDIGLGTFDKLSARGFETGYSVGGGAGVVYCPSFSKCEASYTFNGWVIDENVRRALVTDCYLEGGDGGTGILNKGKWTKITGNMLFPGYLVGIDDSHANTEATTITSNTVGLGASAGSTGILVLVNAMHKDVDGNHIVYTAGTAGVNGLYLTGSTGAISYQGNSFDPSGAWSGAGTAKIFRNGDETYGLTMQTAGASTFPALSRGAISLAEYGFGLNQGDVVGNVLTIPNGSLFSCNASAACNVLKIAGDASTGGGRIVFFRTTTANMTFSSGAYMEMAGGAAFTGPGIIGFLVDRRLGDSYSSELFRAVY